MKNSNIKKLVLPQLEIILFLIKISNGVYHIIWDLIKKNMKQRQLILAMLLIVSLLGTSTEVLIPALGFFYGKGIVRVARAATHDVIAKDFIVSARARGHSNMSIIWNEIIPNVRDAILVEGAMRWSWMLLGFSSLSFLGFGVSPPTPDWGLMISNARGLMSFAYWAVIAPVVGLSSLIIGINLTADAFAKALGIDRSTKAPV